MREVKYSVLESAVARRMRWDFDQDLEEFEGIRDAISLALEEAWRFKYWSCLLVTQQRRFAPEYDSAATYAAGTVVFLTGREGYYVALVDAPQDPPAEWNEPEWVDNEAEWGSVARSYSASEFDSTKAYEVGDRVKYSPTGETYQCTADATGVLPTDTGSWGILPMLIPQVALVEAGYDDIGDVEGVYRENPEAYLGAARINYRVGSEGVLCFDTDVPQPWVRYLPPPHRFTGSAWDATASYGPDETETDSDMALNDTSGVGYAGVAQLRGRTIHTNNQMAYLLYSSAEGDGGAGWFRYVASSADADDGSDRIRPTDNPLPALGCWHRVS